MIILKTKGADGANSLNVAGFRTAQTRVGTEHIFIKYTKKPLFQTYQHRQNPVMKIEPSYFSFC